MKKLIQNSIFVCSLLVCTLNSNGQPPAKELNISQIENSICRITDSLFAGKYEVFNLFYRTFEQDLKNTNQAELLKISTVDSNVWRPNLEYNEPLVRYYYRHPNFENYPVVGVSYEGANLFCKWLTEKYNSNPKRKYTKVIFRLPTEKEWEIAAYGGKQNVTYPWGNRLRNSKGRFLCNFLSIGDEKINYDTLNYKFVVAFRNSPYKYDTTISELPILSITEPVTSFFPNNIGLYNVCGNVAEMIQEKGIAKGGGWKSPGGDVQIKSRSYYSKPAYDLGFRFFMEVIEK